MRDSCGTAQAARPRLMSRTDGPPSWGGEDALERRWNRTSCTGGHVVDMPRPRPFRERDARATLSKTQREARMTQRQIIADKLYDDEEVAAMGNDTAQLQLTAYLLSILVHHDRGIRAVGPPRNRQEWGIRSDRRLSPRDRPGGGLGRRRGGAMGASARILSRSSLPGERRRCIGSSGLGRRSTGGLTTRTSPPRSSRPNIDCRPLEKRTRRHVPMYNPLHHAVLRLSGDQAGSHGRRVADHTTRPSPAMNVSAAVASAERRRSQRKPRSRAGRRRAWTLPCRRARSCSVASKGD